MALSRAAKRKATLVAGTVAGAAVLAGGYMFRQVQVARSMEEWRADGLAAYQTGEHERGVEILNKYVSRDKSDLETLIAFADCRRRLPLPNNAHLQQATEIVRTALVLDPGSLEAQRMLMELYESQRLWTEALEAAEDVLQTDPTAENAHLIKIDARIRTGRTDEAVAAIDDFSRIDPSDPRIQRACFDALREARAPLAVLEAFVTEAAAALDGSLTHELMRLELAATRYDQSPIGSPARDESLSEMQALLTAAMELPAQSVDEVARLVRLLDGFGPDLAESVITRHIDRSDLGPELIVFAAARLWKRGDWSEAASLLTGSFSSLADMPDDALGWLALTASEPSEAAAELLGSREGSDAETWRAIDLALRQLGQENALESIKTLRDAPGFGPENHAVHLPSYVQASAREALGETAAAVRDWEALIERDPSWPIARNRLARGYRDLGRLLDARQALREHIAALIDPLVILEIEIEIDRRRLERPTPTDPDSYELTMRVRDAAGPSVAVSALAARAALATGREEEAMTHVDEVVAAGSVSDAVDVVSLAREIRVAHPDRAAALIAMAEADGPTFESVLERAMLTLAADGEDAARGVFESAIDGAATEQTSTFRAAYGWFLDRIGHADAREYLLELSAEEPDNLEVQLVVLGARAPWQDPSSLGPVIARLQESTGDSSTLWRVYQAKRALAMLEEGDDREASRLVISLNEVLTRDPNNVEALDVAAEATERLENYGRAADFRLQAVRLDPNDAERQFATIDTLTRAGRLDEARSQARSFAGAPLPDLESIARRAELLERYGLTDEAAADWASLAARGEVSAMVREARELWSEGRADEADAVIDTILADPGLTGDAYSRVAGYFAFSDRRDRGIALLAGMPEPADGRSSEERIADLIFRTLGGPADAEELAARASGSQSAFIWSTAAQAFMLQNEFDRADELVRAGLEAVPDARELTSIERALRAADDESPLRDLAYLQISLNTSTAPESQSVAELLDRRLRGDINDDALIMALRERYGNPRESTRQVWQALATAQAVFGMPQDARSTLMDGLDQFPADPVVAQFAARQLSSLGLPREALVAARQWRDLLTAPNRQADLIAAALMLDRGLASEASRVLDPWAQSIADEGLTESANLKLLAGAWILDDRLEDAYELLWPSVEQGSEGVVIFFDLHGAIEDALDRREWLDRISDKVVDLNDAMMSYQLVVAWIALAELSRESADAERALAIAEARLDGRANAAFIDLLAAATANEVLGSYEDAIAQLERARDMEPENVNVLNNLAYVFVRSRTRLPEALSLSERAVSLARARGMPSAFVRSLLDTRAQALLASDRPDEAAAIYEEALREDQGWLTGLLGLAEALHALGDREAANAQVARLRAQDLSMEQAARLEALASSLAGG